MGTILLLQFVILHKTNKLFKNLPNRTESTKYPAIPKEYFGAYRRRVRWLKKNKEILQDNHHSIQNILILDKLSWVLLGTLFSIYIIANLTK